MSGEATKLTKQALDGITLNGQPVYIFVEEESQREREKLHAEEVRKHSSGTGYNSPTSKYGNISGQRSQYTNRVSALSPEILVHVNYLFQKGGEKAVNDFLAMPKQNVEQLGPIESALKDAEEKMRFYMKQEDEARDNRNKWAAVADQLRGAMNIMQGKVTVAGTTPKVTRQPRANGEASGRVPRGFWVEILEKILVNGRIIPRQQCIDEMRAMAPNYSADLPTSALSNAIVRGAVILTDDMHVHLPKVG